MGKSTQVVFWNIWGHRDSKGIHAFIRQHASITDIFCLTEVTDVADEYDSALCFNADGTETPSQVNGCVQLKTEFSKMFTSTYTTAIRSDWVCSKTNRLFSGVGFGSMLLVKHGVQIEEVGTTLIEPDDQTHKSRAIQWIVYNKGATRVLVAHIHGLWIKDNTKGDHSERTQQSLIIRSTLKRIANFHGVQKIIFGGDLNLDINTEAIAIIERGSSPNDMQLRNLIAEHGIKNTRTKQYRKYADLKETKYADYVFVSPAVKVGEFKVLNHVLASDHAPLMVQLS